MATAQAVIKSAWKIIPHLQSRDIEATAAFYKDKLGFTTNTHSHDGVNTTFCSVYAGPKAAANLYYSIVADGAELKTGAVMIALGTKELDQFYELMTADSDVVVTEPVEDKDWGYRQFSIQDPDENKLTFFKFLEGGNPGDE